MKKFFGSLIFFSVLFFTYLLTSHDFILNSSHVVIEKNDSTEKIFKKLKQNDPFFFSGTLFKLVVFLYQQDGKYINPGIYNVLPNMSILDVVKELTSPPKFEKIIFLEGWSIYQIVDKINDVLNQNHPLDSLEEGSLFPDTYYIQKNENAAMVCSRLKNKMEEVCNKLRAQYPLPSPLKNNNEWIILASIVEKESAYADEKPHIASVYLNRLKKNMRLQADPTMNYVASHPFLKEKYKGVEQFNTYKIKGLPLTPICCPGKDSLEAVLNPKETKDLFFVANKEGKHTFSQTFDEHKKHARKWRKFKKEKK